MAEGKVKWFNEKLGYGFIVPSSGEADALFDATALKQAGLTTIREGQQVTYEIVNDRKSGKRNVKDLKLVHGPLH